MTWIRIDCHLPDHAIIGLLAQAPGIDTDRALAYYARTLFGFGNHQKGGRADLVPDVTIEESAKWRNWRGVACR